jgi:FKBP-type peptidyl-prolyl cis-trans isomerase
MLQSQVLVLGDGQNKPSRGKTVMVHFTGKLEDGTTFDSSRKRNEPFEFILGAGQVIRGWEEGVAEMSKGEIRKLICTPEYAYGDSAVPPSIPAKATLIFEIELLDFK